MPPSGCRQLHSGPQAASHGLRQDVPGDLALYLYYGSVGKSISASSSKPNKPVIWSPLQPLAFCLCVHACPRNLPLRSLDLDVEQAPNAFWGSTAAALWLCDVLMC